MVTTATGATKVEGGGRVLARLAVTIAGVLVALALIDAVLRLAVPAAGIARRTVDIQSPAALYVKLDELRRFEGTKVVVLGDSLVFGRTMREHGDADWERHTLSAELQRYLADRRPDRPVMVANLGMNGTLPVDLDELVRIVTPLKPDLVVFDLSLRSFSRDFDGEAGAQTRKWLADLSVGPNGRYATTERRTSVDGLARDFAVNHWYSYRLRDFLQYLLFEGEPVNFVLSLRNAADTWLRTGRVAPPEDQNDLDNIVLLMRARSRYASIDLAADNPQRKALDGLLARLKAAGQKALVFYASENPEMLPQLLPTPTFDALQRELAQAIDAAAVPGLSFVGPLTIFPAEEFIDHVHLNAAGYARLGQELGRRADGMLGRP